MSSPPVVCRELLPDRTVVLDPRTNLWGGSWTPEGVYGQEALVFVAERLRGLERPVLLDVGANTGSFCLLAAFHPGMVCHAFEPWTEVFDILRANIGLNGLEDRVFAHRLAIRDSDGLAMLHCPADPQDAGYATLGRQPLQVSEWREEQVECSTLDEMVRRLSLARVDFIKIDVEGGEKHALLGARETILRDRPELLVECSETNLAQHGCSRAELLRLLSQLGYEHERIGGDDLHCWVPTTHGGRRSAALMPDEHAPSVDRGARRVQMAEGSQSESRPTRPDRLRPASLYYFQAADEFCMHSHDLLTGFHELGIEVFSNLDNYAFLKKLPVADFTGDLVLVSTSGNTDVGAIVAHERIVFVDGRDQTELNQDCLDRAGLYFKTNWDSERRPHPRLRHLPSCTPADWTVETVERDVDVSFLTGHALCGRGDVLQWLRQFGALEKVEVRLGEVYGGRTPLHDRYPMKFCNVRCEEYREVLGRSRIAINAPGGGTNTRKFFEILASGAMCLNYVPRPYVDLRSREVTNGDILRILPERIEFPRQCVVNFSTREELFDALSFYLAHPELREKKAQAGQAWARTWTARSKAEYLLAEIHQVESERASPAPRRSAPRVSVITLPKPWRGEFDRIQRNAITSWRRLGLEVILVGDEEGTAEAAREFGCRHVRDVRRTPLGTPLVNSVFELGQREAIGDLLAYVNADILLFEDFVRGVETVRREFDGQSFLMIGGRSNAEVNEELDWNDNTLQEKLRAGAELFMPEALDYFVFPRGTYAAIPDFAIGRFAWDNWLVDKALAQKFPVIDATADVCVIHQDHAGTLGVHLGPRSPEIEKNLELYFGEFDTPGRELPVAGCLQATYVMEQGAVRPRGSLQDSVFPEAHEPIRRFTTIRELAARPSSDSPLLTLAVLVHEARLDEASLASAAPWADEIVILHTNPDDEAFRVAQRFGAALLQDTWRDSYSLLRNAVIRQARGEWVLWLNPDEVLSGNQGEAIRRLVENQPDEDTWAYWLKVFDGEEDADHVSDEIRLHRRDPELEYEGFAWESILPALERRRMRALWADVEIRTRRPRSHREFLRRRERERKLLSDEIWEQTDEPGLHFDLGLVLHELSRHAEAWPHLSRAISVASPLEKYVRKAQSLLAATCLALGQPRAAWQTAQNGLILHPQDPELIFQSGLAAQTLGWSDRAELAFRFVTELEPERYFIRCDTTLRNGRARLELARVLLGSDRVEEAQSQLEQAVEAHPGLLDAWRELRAIWIDQGREGHARQKFEKLARADATRVTGLVLVAEMALENGDYPVARQRIDEALLHNPESRVAGELLCELLNEAGPIDTALASLERYVDLYPDDAAAQHNLGTAFHRQRRFTDAATAFQASLESRPQAPHTWYCLGKTRWEADETDLAREAWDRGARLAPHDPHFEEALALVAANRGVKGSPNPYQEIG